MQLIVRCLIEDLINKKGKGRKTARNANYFLKKAIDKEDIVKSKQERYYEQLDGVNFYYNTQGWTRDGLFGKLMDYCDGNNCEYTIKEIV